MQSGVSPEHPIVSVAPLPVVSHVYTLEPAQTVAPWCAASHAELLIRHLPPGPGLPSQKLPNSDGQDPASTHVAPSHRSRCRESSATQAGRSICEHGCPRAAMPGLSAGGAVGEPALPAATPPPEPALERACPPASGAAEDLLPAAAAPASAEDLPPLAAAPVDAEPAVAATSCLALPALPPSGGVSTVGTPLVLRSALLRQRPSELQVCCEGHSEFVVQTKIPEATAASHAATTNPESSASQRQTTRVSPYMDR